jgi:hypothetical protein
VQSKTVIPAYCRWVAKKVEYDIRWRNHSDPIARAPSKLRDIEGAEIAPVQSTITVLQTVVFARTKRYVIEGERHWDVRGAIYSNGDLDTEKGG